VKCVQYVIVVGNVISQSKAGFKFDNTFSLIKFCFLQCRHAASENNRVEFFY